MIIGFSTGRVYVEGVDVLVNEIFGLDHNGFHQIVNIVPGLADNFKWPVAFSVDNELDPNGSLQRHGKKSILGVGFRETAMLIFDSHSPKIARIDRGVLTSSQNRAANIHSRANLLLARRETHFPPTLHRKGGTTQASGAPF
jgi:hypothetical protein